MKLNLACRSNLGGSLNFFQSHKSDVAVKETSSPPVDHVQEVTDEHDFVLRSLQYVVYLVTSCNVQYTHPRLPQPDFESVQHRRPSNTVQHRRSSNTEQLLIKTELSPQLHQAIGVHISMIRALNGHLLKQPMRRDSLNPDPELLFRIFTPSSNTSHDDALGFRCSGTDQCSPEYGITTITDCKCLNSQTFVDHCEKSLPSEFISLSESPARLMNFIHGKWELDLPLDVRIAVINVHSMRKLGVLFDRSTAIERHLGLRQTMFVTTSHWIAHRWIPVETIEGYFTLAQFRETCYLMGIISNGKRYVYFLLNVANSF